MTEKNYLQTKGLMHDDVLLISFTSTPRSIVVSARFFPHCQAGILFNSCPLGNICILNVRLGAETDQQNVIVHKAYCSLQRLLPRAHAQSFAFLVNARNVDGAHCSCYSLVLCDCDCDLQIILLFATDKSQ